MHDFVSCKRTPMQAELQQVAESLRQSTKQLCRNLKDNPNVTENMSKVASERQGLQLLLSNALSDLDVFKKIQPLIESVMAQEAAEVQMKKTIEHERTTTAAVRQLRNDLRDEKMDHEEKVWGRSRMREMCLHVQYIQGRELVFVHGASFILFHFGFFRCEKRRSW